MKCRRHEQKLDTTFKQNKHAMLGLSMLKNMEQIIHQQAQHHGLSTDIIC